MFSYNIPVPEPESGSLDEGLKQQIVEFDPEIDTSSTVNVIEDLTDTIREAKDIKGSLNLNIVDFLGDYSEGLTLTDLSGYQPPSGVSNTPLSETASTLENLRVGSVDISEDGNTLTILISARYKPEEEEEFKTDRWGYTETDLFPAMEFVGLADTQSLLIQEFVPYAIEEAGGFANFRESATKSNSIIDRLADLTLPVEADVRSELNQYQEQIQKAQRLDNQMKIADEILDKIIYNLYDLTNEQQELLEEKKE
jgi:hypothetical protein